MPEPAEREAVADEFWAFSLDLYAHPDVAAACLRLQDERGLDVNLLLLCCWLARSGRGRLSEGDLAAAEARAAPWRRDIIEPLRAVRRALKTMPDAAPLYAESKKLELHAEREEQKVIIPGKLRNRAAAAGAEADLAANLHLYLARRGHSTDAADDLISALQSAS